MSDSVRQHNMARGWIGTTFITRRLAAAVVGTLVVLALTHIPQAVIPKPFRGNLFDKAEHAVAYGAIALLFLRSFRRPPGVRVVLVLLLAGGAVAALDEITQPLVSRHASAVDFAADMIGIVLVCAVCLVTRLCRREQGCASALRS
ncbi:MAG: VanZ family protein [Phycisphaerales bacterium]|nr:MAG: VanZ family protein [Phycisphaerales bacterium]